MLHNKGNNIHINVPTVEIEKLIPQGGKLKKEESSEEIRKRVVKAREIQYKRFNKAKIITNSDMRNKHIKEFVKIEDTAQSLLKQAVNNFNLSARTYFRMLKVAQTIADLEASKIILQKHVAEALQYRLRVES